MYRDNKKVLYIIFKLQIFKAHIPGRSMFWTGFCQTQTPRWVLMCKEFKEELIKLGKCLVQEAGKGNLIRRVHFLTKTLERWLQPYWNISYSPEYVPSGGKEALFPSSATSP